MKILFSIAALVMLAGSSNAEPFGVPCENQTPACCATKTPEGITPLPDTSLFHLESSWTNDVNEALQLKNLGGRPQIVTMFFAQCEYACPILVHDMKRIEAALPPEVRTNVGFVLVTFDTVRDTPEALAAYRRTHGLGDNWTLLRGNDGDVLELSALLGVKFKREQRGQFAHSNVISLLNETGEVVLQQLGLNRDPGALVAQLQAMHKGQPD